MQLEQVEGTCKHLTKTRTLHLSPPIVSAKCSCAIMASSVEAEILLTPNTIEKFFQIHSVLDLKGLHLDSAWIFKDHAMLC